MAPQSLPEQNVVLDKPGRLGSFTHSNFTGLGAPVAIVREFDEAGEPRDESFPLPRWARTVATQNRMCGDTYVFIGRQGGGGIADVGPTLQAALANAIAQVPA